MLIIAVTGGIATGKSTVADIFHNKYNIPIIDSDQIARDVVQPGTTALTKIISKFGSDILSPDKSLNRKKLREIIFNNSQNKKWLEELLHPLINSSIKEKIKEIKNKEVSKNNKTNYCLILIPLVSQEYLDNNNYIDKVIVVNSKQSNQIERASQRDTQSDNQIKNIINSQIPNSDRNKLADYIINNNSSFLDLEKQIKIVNNKLIKL